MEIMDTNANVPKDYSLSTLDLCNKNDKREITEVPMSKSMKLNFGVERLLADCEKSERKSPRNFPSPQISDNIESNQSDNNQMGLNLLQQHLIHNSDGNLLKPFPLRFGSNHNRYSHQPPSYFQSNRKVPMTSNIYPPMNGVNYAINTYHNILRLPSLPQLSPNNNMESSSLFNNLKKDCEKGVISSNGGSNVKRKRSWSRAVFSNLQRKGLERQFEFQKYITKPDRKKLAARLGLKDAQVKVWFQNRRMKWRHSTRSATTVNGKTNSQENSDVNDDDQFSSSDDDDADIEIDVVTDH